MVANQGYELRSIRFQNVRGFQNSNLSFHRQNTVLVGPNNAGKTSVLRLIDWVFNGLDEDLIRQRRKPAEAELTLLVPARVANNQARRITLRVHVPDGRHAKRFGAEDHVVQLRVRVLADQITVRHGAPERGEPAQSTELGIEFLNNLRSQIGVLYMGSLRDSSDEVFKEQLREDLAARVARKFFSPDQGGRPSATLTAVKEAVQLLRDTAQSQMEGLWADLAAWTPQGNVATGTFQVNAAENEFIDLLVSSSVARISTGSHDPETVELAQIGAGHQSLITLGLMLSRVNPAQRTLLLIEEPEAFLHPSAQRELARRLFDAPQDVLLTTHSPVVVDESLATDVVLLRDHKIYGLEHTQTTRDQINSALLTGQGSEAVFAYSLLLVEGPGDRAFFETLRRRLSPILGASLVGTMGIVPVGGKTRFGPWIRLLEGFADRSVGDRPISWLVVSDSADAVADTFFGLTAGGVSVPAMLRQAGGKIQQVKREDAGTFDRERLVAATREFNQFASDQAFPLQFAPIDLEYAALAGAFSASITRLSEHFGFGRASKSDLLSKLGSKGGGSAPSDNAKADWMRAEIARDLSWREVSSDVKDILWAWARGAASVANQIIERPSELSH